MRSLTRPRMRCVMRAGLGGLGGGIASIFLSPAYSVAFFVVHHAVNSLLKLAPFRIIRSNNSLPLLFRSTMRKKKKEEEEEEEEEQQQQNLLIFDCISIVIPVDLHR